MAHPRTSRVNVEQTVFDVKPAYSRPAPPSMPPPPPTHMPKREQSFESDDDASTATGSMTPTSSMNNSTVDSPRSALAPTVITRDELLCFRQRVHAPNGKGLHCVSKQDPRLPVEQPEQATKPKDSKVKAKPVGPPPGLSLDSKPKSSVAAPPGLALGAPMGPPPYTAAGFRKEMMDIFKDLALDKNVGRAVRRVRMHQVPSDRQAAELADAITYSLEETRGAVRRTFVAFIAGLVAAFEREKCIEALQYFFLIGYGDLEEEVPKLSRIVDIELLPSLRSVCTEAEMTAIQG